MGFSLSPPPSCPTCKPTVPGPLTHPAGKAAVPGTLGQRVSILLLIEVFLLEKFYQTLITFIFLTKSSSSWGMSETIKPKSVRKTRKCVARRTLFIAQPSLLSETWAQFIEAQPRHRDGPGFSLSKGNKGLKYWRAELASGQSDDCRVEVIVEEGERPVI